MPIVSLTVGIIEIAGKGKAPVQYPMKEKKPWIRREGMKMAE